MWSGLFFALQNFLIKNPAAFLATQKVVSRDGKLVLLLRQILPISHKERDHKSYQINIGGGYNIMCGNDMKKAKLGNTGFPNFTETKDEYEKRMTILGNKIANLIDEGTICVMRQEFAINAGDIACVVKEIKKHAKPGWENPKLHISKFGVMTCFRDEAAEKVFYKDYNDEDLKQLLGNDLADLCQIFKSSESYSIANVHVTFRKPEEAFKKILYTLLNEKIKNVSLHSICLDFVGDKNLSPEKQAKLSKEVFDKICQERISAGMKPIEMVSYLVSSPDGHQKIDDNGEIKFVNVDSCQRFFVFESNENKFHHIAENGAGGRLKYVLSMLIGSVLFAANMTFDDLLATAAEITAAKEIGSIFKAGIFSNTQAVQGVLPDLHTTSPRQ